MNPKSDAKIEITKDGPYIVSGGLPLGEQCIVCDAAGESEEYTGGKTFPEKDSYALCRCGHSANKPFCDGSHKKVQFDGTETASREPYLKQAETIDGPTMSMTDAKPLCAGSGFCGPHGTAWKLVTESDSPEARRLLEHETGHCPSGRLVAWDKKTGEAIEPEYEPSLGLIEDKAKNVSGPIWVRGGIPVISGDGTSYEVRNQATLCRCGKSANKPFCDGSHSG